MNRISTLYSQRKSQRFAFNDRKTEVVILTFIVVAAFIGLYAGWRLFWYLSDDAFIAFRYVSNSLLGYGYVWNPPPFKPVEGYTSFLWVLILDVIWRVFGVMPPDSANWISLLFSSVTLGLSMVMVLKLDWNSEFKKYRLVFLMVFLIAVLANRTFLAWTSSGLETAMFNFFVIYWVYSNFYLQTSSNAWSWNASISATLMTLTRPDGLLFVMATLFLAAAVLYSRWTKKEFSTGDLWALLPVVLIPLHLFWRFQTYGEWLPNTYFAKASPDWFWVTTGTFYFLSFVIEYALWFFLGFAIIFLMQFVKSLHRSGMRPISFFFEIPNLVRWVTVAAILLHFLYYTFVIGGDHFEFRVYSHLVVLIFLSAIWLLLRIAANPKIALTLYMISVLASLPIPWMHWRATHSIASRKEAIGMAVSVADVVKRGTPYTPELVIGYLKFYDGLQSFLIHHFVCVRHQEHKVFWQSLVEEFPSRERGSSIKGDGYPVVERRSIGVLAWVLPYVNVMDKWGLNDYVVARNPDLDSMMLMAHLRQPPQGYVECFEPNVMLENKTVKVIPRVEPMTIERIKACEGKYIQQVKEETQK